MQAMCFYGIKAKYGRSKCLKCFPMHCQLTNYSGFERNAWLLRDIEAHREQVERSKLAQNKMWKRTNSAGVGIHYSQLLEIPLFQCCEVSSGRPYMHNLFLGTARKLLTL